MSEFSCNYCSKSYKHRQNLHRHLKQCKEKQNEYNSTTKKPHDKSKYKPYDKSIISQNGLSFSSKNDDITVKITCKTGENKKTYKCEYCDKVYKHYQSRHKHQKKCALKTEDKDTFTKEEMDQKINEMKTEMMKMFNKQFKMHHKTFDKLKRNLEKNLNNNTTNNNNTINNNTTNNNTTNNNLTNNNLTNNNLTINNNINIIPLGKENFVDKLDKEQQIAVVNSIYNSIKQLCNFTHFNPDTPQYHSFVITNNQNNIAHTYDDKE